VARQSASRAEPTALCPIRLGESCSLCFPGATGPQDCGLVHLVMRDPELREDLSRLRAAHVPTHVGPVR
jgi:hypothetical protein